MSLGQQIQNRAAQNYRAYQVPELMNQASMQQVFNDQMPNDRKDDGRYVFA